MLLRVLVLRCLQIERIDCHHFNRGGATRLRRHEDHGRNSTIDRKRQSIDQFLVRDHLVVAGRQGSINSLQQEGIDERHDFPRRARDHGSKHAGRRARGYSALAHNRRIPAPVKSLLLEFDAGPQDIVRALRPQTYRAAANHLRKSKSPRPPFSGGLGASPRVKSDGPSSRRRRRAVPAPFRGRTWPRPASPRRPWS